MNQAATQTQTRSKDAVTLKVSPIKSGDRLKFTLFMAVCFHLIVLLGIRFTLPETQSSQIPLSLDVTLAQRESLKAPEDADFIGQKNQEGAGDAAEDHAVRRADLGFRPRDDQRGARRHE